ncbi:phage tail tape measure protein [Marinobacter sp.]|uniref:phage tail tape measure protein n=1 Tax=Marinobacter sp. TaxID=50741 RepID=UPI0034A598FB
MNDLELKLKITGDSKGITGTVRATKAQFEQLNKTVGDTSTAGTKGANGLDKVARSGREAEGEMGRLDATTGGLLKSLAGLLSVGLVVREFNAMRNEAQQFRAALAEVSTLMDDLSEMSEVSTQAKELTEAFGGLPVNQVKSFYNIYSAGADNAAEATATLTAANKLAIGGVADLDVAVDGLTSIMNAYEVSGGAAAGISDALFTAMRGGKTTISELSGSIGRVASLASSVDVGFDELLAGISAITTGGVQTAEAVTQVRQVIQGVIKPTAEAAELAEKLGLDFNTTALGAQGLAGFLEEVREATGGNIDQMSLLFGSVEALSGAVALTGPQAGQFADILENMGDKAGATETAYAKMAEDMQNQTDQLAGKFAVLRTEIGEAFVDASLPLVRAFNENFDETIAVVQAGTGVLVTFAGVYGTITAATWGATIAQRAFNAAVKANPYILLGTTLAAAAVAIYSLRDAFDPARERAEELKLEVEQLTSRLQGLSRAQLENQTFALQRQMVESQAEVRTLSADLDKLQDKIRNSGQLTAQGGALPTATPEDLKRAEQLQERIEQLEIAGESAGIAYKQAKDQLAALGRQSDETADSVGGVSGSVGQTKDEAEAAAKALAKLQDRFNALEGVIDPTAADFREFSENLSLLDEALANDLVSPDRFRQLRDQLVQNFAEVGEDGGNELADNLEDQMFRASDRVATALQDSITSGDWDGIGATIGGALAGAIGGMVTETLMEQMAGQAGASIFGPLAGAIAGGVAGLAVNALSDYLSGDDWDPTESRQASQGTGTVLGDINTKSESIRRAVENSENGIGQLVGINQGMLQALQSLQLGIEGAVSMVARDRRGIDFATESRYTQGQLAGGGLGIGIGGVMTGSFGPAFGLASGIYDVLDDALGGILNDGMEFLDDLTGGLLSSIGSSVFGGDQKVVDEGIRIIGGNINDLVNRTLVQAYATIKEDGGWFSSDKRFDRFQDIATNQFSLAFASLYDSIEASADALGIDAGSRLSGFNVDTQRISLEGLSADEQQAELEAYFSTVFDDLAGAAVPFLDEFQRAGEGLGETLARVANQTLVTQEAVDRLGVRFSDLAGRDLVKASERLVEAAGGIEQFIGSMESFIDNFATEAQQFALAGSDITRALEQQGLAVPKTREGYYELLQAQNGATESGSQNIATLLRLQGVADEYYTMLEDYQDQTLRSQQELVSDRLNTAESAARAVTSAIESLTVQTDQFSQMQRLAGLQTLQGMANSGVVNPGEELDRALSAATNINAGDFGSLQDYIREVAVTGNVLADLDQITQEQVTVEERMLGSLERQAELLEQGNAEQLAALSQIQGAVSQNTQAMQSSAGSVQPSAVAGRSSGGNSSNTEMVSEIRRMKSEMSEQQRLIIKHTERTSRILEEIEMYGLEVRS